MGQRYPFAPHAIASHSEFLNDSKHSRRYLSVAEKNIRTGFLAVYLRLKGELPEDLRPLFVVAYHVGNRLGEIRK